MRRVEGPFGEAAGGQGESLDLDGLLARVDDLRFQRQAGQRAAPVALLDDDADVERVARPVHAALGEHEGVEFLARAVLDALDGEAREIQRAVLPLVRQESHVAAQARDDGHGFARVPGVPAQPGQAGAALGIGGRIGERRAAAGQDRDVHPAERRARGQRGGEHVAAAVRVALDDQAQVRDQDEAARLDLVEVLPGFRIPAAGRQEEEALAVQSFGGLEMAGEVERRIIRVQRIAHVDGLRLGGDARQVLLVEAVAQEGGLLEVAFRLAGEVVDLGGGHARDLVADARHAARLQREFPFAAEGQQAALALDDDLLVRHGHGDDVRVVVAQPVAARRGRVLADLDEQAPGRIVAQAEGVRRRLLVARGHGCGREPPGAGERGGVHLDGRPVVQTRRGIRVAGRLGAVVGVAFFLVVAAVVVAGRAGLEIPPSAGFIVVRVVRFAAAPVVFVVVALCGVRRLFGRVGMAGGIVGRQRVHFQRRGEVFRAGGATGLHDEELLGLACLVLDHARAAALDPEEAVDRGHPDGCGLLAGEPCAACQRGQARREPQLHGVLLLGQGQ